MFCSPWTAVASFRRRWAALWWHFTCDRLIKPLKKVSLHLHHGNSQQKISSRSSCGMWVADCCRSNPLKLRHSHPLEWEAIMFINVTVPFYLPGFLRTDKVTVSGETAAVLASLCLGFHSSKSMTSGPTNWVYRSLSALIVHLLSQNHKWWTFSELAVYVPSQFSEIPHAKKV